MKTEKSHIESLTTAIYDSYNGRAHSPCIVWDGNEFFYSPHPELINRDDLTVYIECPDFTGKTMDDARLWSESILSDNFEIESFS